VKLSSAFLFVLFTGHSLWSAAPITTNAPPRTGKFDTPFYLSPPYSSAGEIGHRLSISVRGTPYTLSKEKFQVIVPETYTNDLSWGLLVWVSPSPHPSIPEDWPPALAKHKLLFVSPYNADNGRGAMDRFRLALDASYNMRLRYRITPKRIFVSGFSGGARISSILGVAYSDVFTGTMPVCGGDFYMTIPAGGDQEWKANYKTQAPHLTAAKTNGRFVLITGDDDMNRQNTSAVYEYGFKQYGFANVQYLQVPGMGHAIPSAEYLERALNFLDAGKSAR